MSDFRPIDNTPYLYDASVEPRLAELNRKVRELRRQKTLSPQVLKRIRDYFRIKNIYNSNAIEGNLLNYNETRLVVEQGITISGKPLRDVVEAKNLAHALDLFEQLAGREAAPVFEVDIKNLHRAVLKGVNDQEAGKYRDVDVAISGSKHKPPPGAGIGAEMAKFAAWLKPVSSFDDDAALWTPGKDPILLACAAHTWFVYIHPFVDGNGRVARLLLNLLLMRFGYPIAVINLEDRQRYYESLGESDQAGDLTPLTLLVLENVLESLEEYLNAAKEQKELEDWGRSLVSHFTESEENRIRNEFAVWISAMELLKNQFRQVAGFFNDEAQGLGGLDFRDYGKLGFEKYVSLRQLKVTKETWFFKIQFRSGHKQANYVFWFGFPSFAMRKEHKVTLYVSFQKEGGIYEKLETLGRPDLPDLYEVGYAPEKEEFVWRLGGNIIDRGKIEGLVRSFFTQVVKRQF